MPPRRSAPAVRLAGESHRQLLAIAAPRWQGSLDVHAALKRLVHVRGSVVVEEGTDGHLRPLEAYAPEGRALVLGTLVHALDGPLAGSMGIALGGDEVSATHADLTPIVECRDDETTILGAPMPWHRTLVLAEAVERSTEAIDEVVDEHRGTVVRTSSRQVHRSFSVKPGDQPATRRHAERDYRGISADLAALRTGA